MATSATSMTSVISTRTVQGFRIQPLLPWSSMEFSGRLDAFPPGDLLQWAKNERKSGALVIRRRDREKRVYFHHGDVVACMSNDPAEYYGQHLLLHGDLDEEQLFAALTHCTLTKRRLGAALLELGLLSPERVQQTLREQIEDSVCDLFLWPGGVFYFQSEMPPDEEILPEPIHSMGLVMEGHRWLDEHRRIRSVLINDQIILGPGSRLLEEGGPIERRIVAAADGMKDLAELYMVTRGSYFRFLEAALGLCIGHVLDVVEVSEDGTAPTGHEMTVHDLLLEQATQEQVLVARRHMAVPLDLLERWVPVWVGEPSAEEQRRMPARARDFYARFDGATPLADAFSGDPRARAKEMELLLLQLQKGRLALLPASVDRLEHEASQYGEPAIKRWWRRVFPAPAG